MRTRWMLVVAAASIAATLGFRQAQRRLNPVVDLLAQKKPVFGLYAPSNRRTGRGGAGGRGGRGGAPAPEAFRCPVEGAAPSAGGREGGRSVWSERQLPAEFSRQLVNAGRKVQPQA